MKWMSAIGSALVVGALGLASNAHAQEGGLDVTMRVLDDVSEVDGVVLDLSSDVESDRESDERGDTRADGGDRPDEDRRSGDERDHDVLDDGDREERAEGGIEDHDEAREPVEEEIPADGGDTPVDAPAEEGAI
jgi:hypothetical protein